MAYFVLAVNPQDPILFVVEIATVGKYLNLKVSGSFVCYIYKESLLSSLCYWQLHQSLYFGRLGVIRNLMSSF